VSDGRPVSRRGLLTGALGLAAAGSLASCTRYHPPTPTPVAAPAGSPSSGDGGNVPVKEPALPTIPNRYEVIATRPQPIMDRIELGSFLQLKKTLLGTQVLTTAQAEALRRKQLGVGPKIVHWFYRFDDPFPDTYQLDVPGATLCYSWFGTAYDRILSGRYDERIADNARRLASYGHPMFLRFMWEMNGNWYLHSGPRNGNSPAKFIKTWRYVYDIFQKHGADNVGWVWSPYTRSDPVAKWNTLEAYYPGDDYVDWVGVSGYFKRSEDTPEELFDEIYRHYTARKPMMITETGIARMDPAVMVGRLKTLPPYLDQRPGICAILWFDTNVHVNGQNQHVDLRIDINKPLLAAYKSMAHLPMFVTT